METVYGLLKAVVAHIYLAWIHPFGDGNGRTARLVESDILLNAGVPSPAAHLFSNHYSQTRAAYYRELDRASKLGGDLIAFLTYAMRGFVDGLREQLEFVWNQQWDVVWRNYVHELFQSKNTVTQVRQRHLALDLGHASGWIDVSAVVDLSTRLAAAYAKRTTKTLHRDLGELEEMGLVERQPRQVRARREVIFSFLPFRRDQDHEGQQS